MIRLEKVLKNGGVATEKETIHRLKRVVENSARPIFGGVALRDLTFSFPLSAAYTVCFLTVFFYLLITNITTTLGTQVLSLDQNAKGMNCTPIAKSLKGQWNADAKGNWDSEKDFQDETALFVFSAKGQKIGKDQYEAALDFFWDEIDDFAKYAGNRTMAWNLIMLSSLTFSHKESGLQFCLSADASLIYDTMIKVATLSNENGICLGYDSDSVSTSNSRRFLSASYKTEEAALTLELPLRINVSSVMGANLKSPYSITFSPAVEEPCPQHGKWFQHLFYGADAAFRDGFADVGFDVRSTALAIALNLGRVGTASLVRKDTEMTRTIGMIGLVDPYYAFPHMARIYCVDKSSKFWGNYAFSKDEKEEQANYFNETVQTQLKVSKSEYPNICFVVSVNKGNAIQFFYPMVSMLKPDRDKCWNEKPKDGQKSACKEGIPPRRSNTMLGCTCPADKTNIDCNRQSLYTSYFYDTNFQTAIQPSSPGAKWSSTKDRIQTDSAIMLGIAMQKEMVRSKYPNYPDRGKVNNDYDVWAMQQFVPVVAKTVTVWNNPTLAKSDPKQIAILELAESWKNLILNVQKVLGGTIKTKPALSAIVFRSYGSIGGG